MPQHESYRGEFIRILLSSAVFQRGLNTISQIASEVQAHAPPLPNDNNHHSFQFGQQWKFTDLADSRFIQATVSDIRQHLSSAENVELPELTDTRFMGLKPSTITAVLFTAAMGPGIINWRASAVEAIARIANDLLPLTMQLWGMFAPSHIRCHHKPNTHIAFIALVTQALSLTDSNLAFDLCVGMPAIGTIPSTGNWRVKVDEGRDIFSADENIQWNTELHSSMQNSPLKLSAEERRAYLATITEEIDAGLCDGYYTFDDIDEMFGKGNWRAIRSFPVKQKGRYRRCDDARESLHNSAASLTETITTIMADWPIRAAAAFAAALGFEGEPWQMQACTDDMFKAYRMAPCSQPQYTVTAVFNELGEVRYLVMAGFNFGLKAAVPMFNRIPFFSTEITRRLLGGVCDHYFDDIVAAEPSWAAAPCPISDQFPDGDNSIQSCLWCMHAIIGFPLALAKKRKLAATVLFLGVISDFTKWWLHGEASLYTDRDRQSLIADIVGRAIATSSITRQECESLAGKLSFLLQWSAGRFGRAVLRPLYDHITSRTASMWNKALHYAFLFIAAIIMKLPRSVFKFKTKPRPTVKIWTDACWEPTDPEPAGIGIVVYFPAYTDNNNKHHKAYYAHAYGVADEAVILKFKSRKQYIGQLELYAALIAYTTFKKELHGRKVVHWIDNTSALASLIKGYSSVPDSAQIVHAFHSLNLGLKCKVWFEYVNTKANIADLPSRKEFELLHELGSTNKDIVFPTLAAFDDDAAIWLASGRGFSEGQGPRHRAAPAGEEAGRRRRRRH